MITHEPSPIIHFPLIRRISIRKCPPSSWLDSDPILKWLSRLILPGQDYLCLIVRRDQYLAHASYLEHGPLGGIGLSVPANALSGEADGVALGKCGVVKSGHQNNSPSVVFSVEEGGAGGVHIDIQLQLAQGPATCKLACRRCHSLWEFRLILPEAEGLATHWELLVSSRMLMEC